MVPRPSSTAAVLALLIGAGLLANPLYLHAADSGDVLVTIEPTSPSDGAASLSEDIERTEDLSPVSRYAIRQALEDGPFTVNKSAPPLAFQLFDTEWRYLGSQERTALYRPRVSFGTNTTTIRLENVSFQAVETALGVTPPGRLNRTDHPREIAWLDQEFETVVTVGEFDGMWERRFGILVETGTLTVPNGNNISTFAPLSAGEFVVRDDRFYRIALQETAARVTLRVPSADNQTVLSEADVGVVTTNELPSDVRETVLQAIRDENRYTRFTRAETNVSRLDELQRRLIRHEGTYYVLKRGHVDDINLVPAVGLGLTFLGAVMLLGGAWLEWRARTN